MPTISIDIPATSDSVIRPVVLDIIRDIKQISGIDINSKTYFLGATGKALQPNTALDGVTDNESSNTDTMVQIEVIEEYPEGTALTEVVERRDNQPDFYDPVLGVMIKPAYSRAEFTLNIKARFPDRVSAVRWRNEFKRHTTSGRRTNTHKVTYHYAFPDEILMILAAVHRLREKQAPYGEDLPTYIRKYLSFATTTLTDRAGNNPLLVTSQTQNNVLGRFDIIVAPEPAEVDKERGVWEVTFPYKFSMDVPTVSVMRYPLVVHNRMLNKKWRPNEVPNSLEKSLYHRTLTQEAYEPLREIWPGEKRGVPGVSYPFYDDWLSPIQFPFYSECLRIALTFNADDLHGVIDLNDLGDFVLDPLLLAFVQERPGNLRLIRRSVIKVTLYNGNNPMGDTEIEIGSDMKVTTVEPIDLRSPYHLTISLLVDLTVLANDVIDELRKHGELCIALFKLLYPTLEKEGLIPTLLSNGSMSRVDFLRIANMAKDRYLDEYGRAGNNFYTVGLYTIIARKR